MKTLIPTLLCCFLAASLHAGTTTKTRHKEPLPQAATALAALNPDDPAGIGADRQDELLRYTQQMIRECQNAPGGPIKMKVSCWRYKNRIQFYAQRYLESNPVRDVLQGSNAPMGYHTSVRWFQIYPGREVFERENRPFDEPARLARLETNQKKPRISFLNALRFIGKKCPVPS